MSKIHEIFGTDAHSMTVTLMEAANVADMIPSGASVALKPNLVVSGSPDNGATTHAGVLSGRALDADFPIGLAERWGVGSTHIDPGDVVTLNEPQEAHSPILFFPDSEQVPFDRVAHMSYSGLAF